MPFAEIAATQPAPYFLLCLSLSGLSLLLVHWDSLQRRLQARTGDLAGTLLSALLLGITPLPAAIAFAMGVARA